MHRSKPIWRRKEKLDLSIQNLFHPHNQNKKKYEKLLFLRHWKLNKNIIICKTDQLQL